MKKSILVFGMLTLFLFASCGGNKWSCKKRYCKAPTELAKDVKANSLAMIVEEDCIDY